MPSPVLFDNDRRPSMWDDGLHHPYQWPVHGEPVDGLRVGSFWARQALQHANPEILARYLREADEVDPAVLAAIAGMLDRPRCGWMLASDWTDATAIAQLSPAHIAELLDPREGSPRMQFKRPRAGNPQYDPLRSREQQIGFEIWAERKRQGGKLYLAVKAVMKRRHISRATAYRAWKMCPKRTSK
jgi:hypothetical protein